MRDIKNFLYIFISLDILLILFSLYKGGDWLINSQLAFLSSLFITFASFLSYKKNILNKIEKGDIPLTDDRDELDKIDDKFELFEEEREVKEEDFAKIIKEEKRKQKGLKNAIFSLKTSLPSFLSPLRFLGYLLLVASFFYLNRHQNLNIFAFLSGLFVVPLGTLIYSFKK